MREEIFGPILPIIEVDSLEQAIGFANELAEIESTPLALYTFSEDTSENDRVIAEVRSGGACVNGTLLHVSNPNLPFGGVGESGMGAYHGKYGFDTFSHHRAAHTRTTRIDPPLIYPPYTTAKHKLVRKGLTMPDPRDVPAKLRNSMRRN